MGRPILDGYNPQISDWNKVSTQVDNHENRGVKKSQVIAIENNFFQKRLLNFLHGNLEPLEKNRFDDPRDYNLRMQELYIRRTQEDLEMLRHRFERSVDEDSKTAEDDQEFLNEKARI